MKKCLTRCLPLALALLASHAMAGSPAPEPGPEAAGLRLRLIVTPHPDNGLEGYDIQLTLINVRPETVPLRAYQWRSRRHGGGFTDFFEAASSIESYPAIEPWLGQIQASVAPAPAEPEYNLKPGEPLSRQWHTAGRHLKNTVSNPLEVQNPEFNQPGLYSVQATLVLAAGADHVRLRSNEQLVPIGGSVAMPKHTYGPLWWTDERDKTAGLGLGSLHQIAVADRFLVRSGNIGMTWTLTITKVEPDRSLGALEPSQPSPTPAFPSRGAFATLIPANPANNSTHPPDAPAPRRQPRASP
jgi:hypothetical protein